MAPRHIATGVVMVLLLLSIPGVTLLPVGPFLGLDFQNLDAFHACAASANPYLATGVECGDELGRDMYYPPLLYWTFAWTRLVPFSTAFLIWAAVIVIGLLAALSAWIPRGQHGARTAVFILLLLAQLPVLYAIERGNNDVLVVIGWTIAALLFAGGRHGSAGFVAGAAVATKIYPAFAAIVVGLGVIAWALRRTDGREPLVRFAGGGILAVVLAGVVFFDQTIAFMSDELTRVLGTYEPQLDLVSHPLGVIAPGGMSLILSLPLLAVWGFASARSVRIEPMLVFAGGLAISTYFASVSNDYNLITTYPLLLLLFIRATDRRPSWLSLGLLLLGLLGIVGNRQWFDGAEALAVLHTGLQWLWLMAAGAAVALVPERLTGRSEAPDRARPALDGSTVPLPAGTTFSSLHDT